MIHRLMLSVLNKRPFIRKWSGSRTGLKRSEKAANDAKDLQKPYLPLNTTFKKYKKVWLIQNCLHSIIYNALAVVFD